MNDNVSQNNLEIITRQSINSPNILSQIFKSDIIGSNELRVLGTSDDPLFVAKEIAIILGYKDTDDAIRRHIDIEDKLTFKQFKNSRSGSLPGLKIQDTTILINESGLYSLALRSKLEQAKLFKRWITSEVIPSIRKIGQYKLDELQLKLLHSERENKRIMRKHSRLTEKHQYYKFMTNGPAFYLIDNGIEYKDGKKRPKFGIAGCSIKKHSCPDCKCTTTDKDSLDKRLKDHRVTMPHLQVLLAIYTADAALLEKCIKRVFRTEINPAGHEIIDDVSPDDVIIEIMKILEVFNVRNKEPNYKIAHDIEQYNIVARNQSKYKLVEDSDDSDDDDDIIKPVELSDLPEKIVDDDDDYEFIIEDCSDDEKETARGNIVITVDKEELTNLEEKEEVTNLVNNYESLEENESRKFDDIKDDENAKDEEIKESENMTTTNLYDMKKIRELYKLSSSDYENMTTTQLEDILRTLGGDLKIKGLKETQIKRIVDVVNKEMEHQTLIIKKDEVEEEEVYCTRIDSGITFSQRKNDKYINFTLLTVSCAEMYSSKTMTNWKRHKERASKREKYLEEHPHIKPLEIVKGHKQYTWVHEFFAFDFCEWVGAGGLVDKLRQFLNRGDIWDEKEEVTTKRCSCCKAYKDFSAFSLNKTMDDGYERRCIACKKEAYENKKTERAAKALESYHENKTTVNKVVQKVSNPTEHKERQKNYMKKYEKKS